MFYHLNKGTAHCASPPTWQVLLLEMPFILLIQKEKAFSVWFSSPQPPPHYFHASPPTCQVLLLDLLFILLIWKEIALSFYSPPIPPPFPSPTSHLLLLPCEKRIINQPNTISLLIVNWSEVIAGPVSYDLIWKPKNTGSSILINVGRHKNYLGSQTIH